MTADETTQAPIVVLGIGNILLGDEGLGVRAVERLQERYVIPPAVEVVDGGTAGLDLMPYVRRDSSLIIVDAIVPGAAKGKPTLRLENDQVPAFLATKMSPHQIGLSDLLASSILLDQKPSKVVFFGMEPENMDTGLELSDRVSRKVDELVGTLADEITALGVSLVKR